MTEPTPDGNHQEAQSTGEAAFRFSETELPKVVAETHTPDEIIEQFEQAGMPTLAESAKTNAADIARDIIGTRAAERTVGGSSPIYDDHRNLLVAGLLVDLSEHQSVEYETFFLDDKSAKLETNVPSNQLNAELAGHWLDYARYDMHEQISPETAIDCALARISKIGYDRGQTEALSKLVETVGYERALDRIRSSAT